MAEKSVVRYNYSIHIVYKPVGATPFQIVQKVKETHPGKISYAGRLDPMADGLLLLLVGEENKNRKAYEALPKTYRFSFVTGITTDTFDILGKITDQANEAKLDPAFVEKHLQSFIGQHQQAYPPYSSKTVHGKPLFWWARNNKLSEIPLPSHAVEITNIALEKYEIIEKTDLADRITKRIQTVTGNFRQTEILAAWNDFFITTPRTQFPLFHCTMTCSGGTYVRMLVQEIGKKLAAGAVTYSITRTRIGNYTLSDALSVV